MPKRKSTARGRRLRCAELRIVGGRFRGRKLLYHGDPRTRPMKDRLREAIFNLLGPAVRRKHAIDLFAGTGALGLEAVSRGAAAAVFIEQHFPTAEIIRRNAAALGVDDVSEIVAGNVFLWPKQRADLGPDPWVVFCSPPYDFYVERTAQMLELIGELIESAPELSVFVVEADGRFDFQLLPDADAWDVRTYRPAVVGIYRKDVSMDVINIGDVEAFTTKDGSQIRELLAYRNSCIRNQTLAEARLPVGRTTTPHRHVKTEEIYYILAGQGRMQLGDESRRVVAGDAIAIPPGAVHQIANTGGEVLRFLCCCAPPYEHDDTVLAEQ